MGLPVNQYITTKRIHWAADLIRSGMSAMDASAKVGYTYYSTFFYNYKKVMGTPPTNHNGSDSGPTVPFHDSFY